VIEDRAAAATLWQPASGRRPAHPERDRSCAQVWLAGATVRLNTALVRRSTTASIAGPGTASGKASMRP